MKTKELTDMELGIQHPKPNEFSIQLANILFAGLNKIDQLTDEQLDHLFAKEAK